MHYDNADSLYSAFHQIIRFHYYRIHTLLEKVGAYPGQPPLFFALSKKDGMSQRELAQKLNIKAATVTIMLNRMQKAKLIERRQDSSDQRVSRVYLTEQGKKIYAEVKEALKIVEAECFSNFTEEEKLLLRRLFLQMRDNLAGACGNNFQE